MKSLVTAAAPILFAASAAAQGIAFCPSSTALEFARWARDGSAEAGVVSLVGPLSDESVREIAMPDEAPTLQCDSDGLLPATERAERASTGARPPVLVTCSQILSSSSAWQTGARDLGLWAGNPRQTEDGEDVFYVVTSVVPEAGSGAFVLRVVLRERVSKRVERELVLLEAGCAGAAESAQDE